MKELEMSVLELRGSSPCGGSLPAIQMGSNPVITPGLSTLIRRMMVSLCPEQGRRGSNQI